jgi:SNF2 family DNA or RNA helicase
MERMVARLLVAPGTPRLNLPSNIAIRNIEVPPSPVLQVELSPVSPTSLTAVISFEYEGVRISASDPDPTRFLSEERALVRRDMNRERELIVHAESAGVNAGRIKTRILPSVVRTLTADGWIVQGDGRAFRTARASRWSVSSGIDWFELEGSIDFETAAANMPEILLAARRGEQYVRLGDGSIGLLPEEWLERFGQFARMGDVSDGKVRFRRNQALLLDAMLAAQGHVNVDETFHRIRQELESFEGIRPPEQPVGFVGTLRDYQREGLGWMDFLGRFGLGGCLADDMGVGKTAQVLARLENRRAEGHGPSLAVVPRSLIFNWKQEAERFTPALRVLDHTGSDRSVQQFDRHDLVLTTYGTLRRDIEAIREIELDYAILDEAQAIRNASTDAAKAARLLKARHRLALTGTPVENRLNDLWSIFEFLNPGMLGSGRAFDALAASTRGDIESETRTALAKVLRPFILRRTKHQVARELPEKTEQTIQCELEGGQRKLYNEIRDHYRGSLLRGKNDDELKQSKIQVLEALLRLRQAACHPGLIDVKRTNDGSAKVDVLLASLSELAAEGNKALVFSQFTSLLSIVRRRLDEAKLPYEYLDGRTRDRQARVERFQNDSSCPFFLISLKAGGLGLNLTAAEYVFLLDPWWNPAVEQQAIDRAHRIGQTKPVVAYRLIAKDTVEEKVQELQKSKRDLAKALIGDENRLIAELKRDDLELLLS